MEDCIQDTAGGQPQYNRCVISFKNEKAPNRNHMRQGLFNLKITLLCVVDELVLADLEE